MKFNPGEYSKSIGGKTYLKDASTPQPIPATVIKTPPQEEEVEKTIEEIKPETNEPVQSKPVEKKPNPKGGRTPKRKPSSKSDRPSDIIS